MLAYDITNQDLESELNVIHIDSVELDEIISSHDENDVSVFSDADLTSLIEDLLYNGFSFSQIQKMNNQLYGDFIDFFYTNEQYTMIIGVR